MIFNLWRYINVYANVSKWRRLLSYKQRMLQRICCPIFCNFQVDSFFLFRKNTEWHIVSSGSPRRDITTFVLEQNFLFLHNLNVCLIVVHVFAHLVFNSPRKQQIKYWIYSIARASKCTVEVWSDAGKISEI